GSMAARPGGSDRRGARAADGGARRPGTQGSRARRGSPADQAPEVTPESRMILRFVPLPELERIRALEGDPVARTTAFADACRLNALYMIERAGSGHPGTTFSSLDVVTWLHLDVLGEGDRYFSSKGHDVPGLYAVLAGLGRIDFDLVHQLRRLDGLPGHPDVVATPEVVTSTGSL